MLSTTTPASPGRPIPHPVGILLLFTCLIAVSRGGETDNVPQIPVRTTRHTMVETPPFQIPSSGGTPAFRLSTSGMPRAARVTTPDKPSRPKPQVKPSTPADSPGDGSTPHPPIISAKRVNSPGPLTSNTSRKPDRPSGLQRVTPAPAPFTKDITTDTSLAKRFLYRFRGMVGQHSGSVSEAASRQPPAKVKLAQLPASTSRRTNQNTARQPAEQIASQSKHSKPGQPAVLSATQSSAAKPRGRLIALQRTRPGDDFAPERVPAPPVIPPPAPAPAKPETNPSPKLEEVEAPVGKSEQPANATEATPLLDHQPIADLTLQINRKSTRKDAQLEFPPNLAASYFAKQKTIHADSAFPVTYHSPNVENLVDVFSAAHMPVYFEEEQLERNGTGKPMLQPLISGAHFFGNVVSLPYKMVVEPPRRTRYYTYPYAAGRVAPKYLRPYPLRIDASAAEVAVIIGLIALIP